METHLAGAQLSYAPCVTDDFITTGRGMGCAIPFACAIVERYQGKQAAEQMAATVVYTGK
jgi:4-methyl-5(b-hydroxyethyl)-thiazole monophosphate biosynthesis